MPCELNLKSKEKKRKAKLKYTYPNEPNANSNEKITISKDGTKINGKKVVSRSKNLQGDVEIFAEYLGKDGNEGNKAVIRNIYIFGENKFIIQKEIRFEGSNEWIKRNEYNFERK